MNQGKKTRKIRTKECLGQRCKVRVLEKFETITHQSPGTGKSGINQL